MSEIKTPQLDVLTDEQMAQQLNSVNNEMKALLVLGMEPGTEYGQGALHRLITSLPGAENAYTGNRTNRMTDCQSVLEPVGVVRKAEDANEYGLTRLGQEVTQPLAAALLLITDKYQVPMRHVIGQANRGGSETGSGGNRLQIMQHLMTTNLPVRITDLHDDSSVHTPSLHSHLKQLESAGLVEYDHWMHTRDEVTYKLKDPEAMQSRVHSGLRAATAHYLLEHPETTLTEVTDHLATTDFAKKYPEPNVLRQRVAVAMRDFEERYGYIERQGQNPSVVNLTEKQQEFWSEVLNAVESIRTGDKDFKESVLKRAHVALANPEFVARVINRAAEASSLAKNRVGKSVGEAVLKVLKDTDHPTSPPELQERASKNRLVSNGGIRAALRILDETGQVAAHPTSSRTKRYERQSAKAKQAVM